MLELWTWLVKRLECPRCFSIGFWWTMSRIASLWAGRMVDLLLCCGPSYSNTNWTPISRSYGSPPCKCSTYDPSLETGTNPVEDQWAGWVYNQVPCSCAIPAYAPHRCCSWCWLFLWGAPIVGSQHCRHGIFNIGYVRVWWCWHRHVRTKWNR